MGNSYRWLILAPVVALVLAVVVVFAVFASSQPSVAADSTALAKVNLAMGGGKVLSVHATSSTGRAIPVTVSDGRIYPKVKLHPNERVSVTAVVSRPGWIGWLAGSRDTEKLSLSTPTTSLESQFLTLASGAPLKLSFTDPVTTFAYGQPGALQHKTFSVPQSTVSIKRPSTAGTLTVAAAPRSWETEGNTVVAWFPAGAQTSAVTNPNPGRSISATSPITLTFSKPYSKVLGSSMPTFAEDPTGTWKPVNSHTLQFKPSGYGFGLGTTISVDLPKGVQVVGGHATWTVPSGSSLRVNEILAQLGYLPVSWQPDSRPVASTLKAQLSAATKPPSGHFSWIYGNTPSSLMNQWNPDQQTVVTQGALMAFEENEGIYGSDPTPAQVWHDLITAAIADKTTHFGYTYVMVSEGSPESLNLWHNGHTVLTTAVNTGISQAPTATGTYPVFEHLPVTTMTGVNPDGTPYSDPGIPWVSYFNGGDALHGFIRASYGFPQSLGCVEMPYATAGRVYPYTPIGTLVNVA
jgi:hypothetical protein